MGLFFLTAEERDSRLYGTKLIQKKMEFRKQKEKKKRRLKREKVILILKQINNI